MDEDLDTLYSDSTCSDDEWRDLFERCLDAEPVEPKKLCWLQRVFIKFFMWIGRLIGLE